MSTEAQWIAIMGMLATFALCCLFYRRGYKHGHEMGKVDAELERMKADVRSGLRGSEECLKRLRDEIAKISRK